MNRAGGAERERVWDPWVRICHWGIVLGFFVAYVTEDEVLALHVFAGYLVAGLVGFRVLWGFIGSGHARFRDSLRPPREIAAYIARLAEFRPERHLGHSPAGGAMMLVLLAALAMAVVSGMWVYAVSREAGPLAPLAARVSAPVPSSRFLPPTGANAHRESSAVTATQAPIREDGVLPWDEVHELIVTVTLFLVVGHVLGVLLVSMLHHENLTKAMFTGQKRPLDPPG